MSILLYKTCIFCTQTFVQNLYICTRTFAHNLYIRTIPKYQNFGKSIIKNVYMFVCCGITARLKYMAQCGDVTKVYNLFVCSMSRDQVTESRDHMYKQLHV